jgi:hypothetical protein
MEHSHITEEPIMANIQLSQLYSDDYERLDNSESFLYEVANNEIQMLNTSGLGYGGYGKYGGLGGLGYGGLGGYGGYGGLGGYGGYGGYGGLGGLGYGGLGGYGGYGGLGYGLSY